MLPALSPGAPDIATVGNADGMVQLFNSAASQMILSKPKDAALFEAYYKAMAAFDKAADRPTWARSLRTGKASANFLGKNLSSQLAPTADDLTRYGIDGGTPLGARRGNQMAGMLRFHVTDEAFEQIVAKLEGEFVGQVQVSGIDGTEMRPLYLTTARFGGTLIGFASGHTARIARNTRSA